MTSLSNIADVAIAKLSSTLPFVQYIGIRRAKNRLTRADVIDRRSLSVHIHDPKMMHAIELGLFEDEDILMGQRVIDRAHQPSADNISESNDLAHRMTQRADEKHELNKDSTEAHEETSDKPNDPSQAPSVVSLSHPVMSIERSKFNVWLQNHKLKNEDRPSPYIRTGKKQRIYLDGQQPISHEVMNTDLSSVPNTMVKNDEEQNEASLYSQLIDSSQLLKDNIVSETLAELLADHGHNDLAINMYEKLMKANPKKIAFFAARIEELNNE